MKIIAHTIAAFMILFLLIAVLTGLRMGSFGIWAFQLHRIAGVSSLIMGLTITFIWLTAQLKILTNHKHATD
jgi:hypothetical protein